MKHLSKHRVGGASNSEILNAAPKNIQDTAQDYYRRPTDCRSLRQEAKDYIDELGVLMFHAVNNSTSDNFSPKSFLLPLLRELTKNPQIIVDPSRRSKVNLEALGLMAKRYRRRQEPEETHWYDLLEWEPNCRLDHVQQPTISSIKSAGTLAYQALKAEKVDGNRGRIRKQFAEGLYSWLTRYGKEFTQQVKIGVNGGSGSRATSAEWLFDIVLEPINQQLKKYHVKPISKFTLIDGIESQKSTKS